MPVASRKCPSVRILIVPGVLAEVPAAPVVRQAVRPRGVLRVARAVRRVVPVLVVARVVRVPAVHRVRVATVSRADHVVTVKIVDRVPVEMTVGPVVMVMVRIVPVVTVRVRVDHRVRVATVSRADLVVTVSRAVLVVMVKVRIVRVGMARVRVARRVLVVMVMVRIVRVVMARVRVVRRVRVATVSRADHVVTVSRADHAVMVSRVDSDAVTTTVAVGTSFVGRASPVTKPNVDAWRCAPKVAAPLARISSRRAKSACPNNGSTKVRWTPSNCVTPPKRRPSALLGKPARMANSIPR